MPIYPRPGGDATPFSPSDRLGRPSIVAPGPTGGCYEDGCQASTGSEA